MTTVNKRFVYLSRRKISHEFDKIDPSLFSQLGVELGVNILGVVQMKGKRDPQPSSIFTKLDVVLLHLQKFDRIGTISSSSSYFLGEADLRWGEFLESGIVYFTGYLDGVILGLTGSLKHVPAYEEVPSLKEKVGSASAPLHRALAAELPRSKIITAVEHLASRHWKAPSSAERESVLDAVFEAESGLTGPMGSKQRLEFVAERLCQDPASSPVVVLGTPLYVARADSPP